jgi:hypothetical protein
LSGLSARPAVIRIRPESFVTVSFLPATPSLNIGALTRTNREDKWFHHYSFGNILEIARQKPDATRVAGLYA